MLRNLGYIEFAFKVHLILINAEVSVILHLISFFFIPKVMFIFLCEYGHQRQQPPFLLPATDLYPFL